MSPVGSGGCTKEVSRPRYEAQPVEKGKDGSHCMGWIVAVKKGSVADGSSGNTSIFKGHDGEGEMSGGVNLKRARCLIRGNVSKKPS